MNKTHRSQTLAEASLLPNKLTYLSVFGEEFLVFVRVCFHENPRPILLELEVECVGEVFTVEGPGLEEEAVLLLADVQIVHEAGLGKLALSKEKEEGKETLTYALIKCTYRVRRLKRDTFSRPVYYYPKAGF